MCHFAPYVSLVDSLALQIPFLISFRFQVLHGAVTALHFILQCNMFSFRRTVL